MVQLPRLSEHFEHILEGIFAAKYRWIISWALHYAQDDSAAAEDLVQAAFVRVPPRKKAGRHLSRHRCKQSEDRLNASVNQVGESKRIRDVARFPRSFPLLIASR